jgi:DNA topoisomerase IB
VYVDAGGNLVTDPTTIERIKALVIPPAWNDVWICPVASGHIQATGVDARGRRQYRYHDVWRLQRDLEKHDRILDFASRLPAARERIRADLDGTELTRERVLACAVRLLDLGFFRIGGEQYAEENQTYGLATMRKEHVQVSKGILTFDYTAKSGKHLNKSLAEPEVGNVIAALKRRRGGGEELLAYRGASGEWVDVKSADINAYLRSVTEGEDSAKDFRTWSATVLCAVALGVSERAATSPTAIKRAVTRAVRETADYLGNTPAVCRASYIHPRVIDLYMGGVTIAEDLERIGEHQDYGHLAVHGDVEAAVSTLLRSPQAARAASRRRRLAEGAAKRSATRQRRAATTSRPATRPSTAAGRRAA